MTKYKMKDLDSQFIVNRHLGHTYNIRWIIFPFFRVDRDKKTKEIMMVSYSGWFSKKLKQVVSNIHDWDYETGDSNV